MRLTLDTFDKASKKVSTQTRVHHQHGLGSVRFDLNEIKFVSSKYDEMDCLKSAKNYVLSTLSAPREPFNNKSRRTKLRREIKNAATRCQTAKDITSDINDSLMLLIVLAACAINMIFQSTIPIFNGKLNTNAKYIVQSINRT